MISWQYLGSLVKTTFACSNGHKWDARPSSILYDGAGCPVCADRGGYKRHLPGWIYVLKFANFIKYGITNNPKKRLSQHRRVGMFETLLLIKYDDGNIPWQWEISIKKTYGGSFISKDIMPNGYTETLSLETIGKITGPE